MKYTPYAAFGKIVILVQADVGDTRIVKLGIDGLVTSGYYFYIKGCAKVNVIETNEHLEDRPAGWLNLEHPDSSAKNDGHIKLTFPVETEWLCIPHMHNKKGLPTLKSVIVKTGETAELENGTDLFLGRGTLEINSKLFIGPCQIRIRSGNVAAKCLKNSYGLIFT